MQATLAAAELERMRILERQALEAGDTKWTLHGSTIRSSLTPPNLMVVSASYGELDVEKDSTLLAPTPGSGRKRFGKFGEKVVVKRQESHDSDISREDGEAGNGTGHDMDPEKHDSPVVSAELRAKRLIMKKEKRDAAADPGKRRRSKEVKLNDTFHSGGQRDVAAKRSASNRGPLSTVMECHRCGERGHKKTDCPNKKRRSY